MIRIPIYNYEIPKKPRIFDVEVNEDGTIQKYITQNIKGCVFIDDKEVRRQIYERLNKNKLKNAS